MECTRRNSAEGMLCTVGYQRRTKDSGQQQRPRTELAEWGSRPLMHVGNCLDETRRHVVWTARAQSANRYLRSGPTIG